MVTANEWFETWKTEKRNALFLFGNNRFNHPNRLAGVAMTGTLNYVIDERDFVIAGDSRTSCKRYTFNLSVDGADPYERIYESRSPWVGNGLPAGTPDQGKFVLSHVPLTRMWEFRTNFGADTDGKVLGTTVVDNYSRVSSTDPWPSSPSSTESPTDITYSFGFFLSVGGDPVSGGKDDESADEAAEIEYYDRISGTSTSRMPNFSVTFGRFPWDDNWAAESQGFTDFFTEFLAEQNADDGGGHSGSCGWTMVFS